MKKRNYGIDLMRIISMLYVIVLHILFPGAGGVLKAVQPGSASYDIAWFLEIWAYCAVDIFGLISGYVGFHQDERPVKFSNYIQLWLEVVAYGLMMSFVFWLRHPELVSKTDFVQMCFPVTSGLYWYFTAYTGLVLIMPVLNYAMQKAPERALRKLFVVLVVPFSFYSTLIDRFTLSAGYSFIWLVILYLLGGIIRKCDIGKSTSSQKAFIWIVILMVITWIWKLKGLSFQGSVINITPDLLISYVSPTILLASAFYLIGASKLKISGRTAEMIEFGGSSAFAAYIINCQRFFWNYEMNQRFVWLADVHAWMLPVYVIGFAALFVIISILIDKVRMLIFRILHISQLSKWIDKQAHKIMEMLVQ